MVTKIVIPMQYIVDYCFPLAKFLKHPINSIGLAFVTFLLLISYVEFFSYCTKDFGAKLWCRGDIYLYYVNILHIFICVSHRSQKHCNPEIRWPNYNITQFKNIPMQEASCSMGGNLRHCWIRFTECGIDVEILFETC